MSEQQMHHVLQPHITWHFDSLHRQSWRSSLPKRIGWGPSLAMFPVVRCVFLFNLVQVVVFAYNIILLLHLRRKGASSSSFAAVQGTESQADVAAGFAQIFRPEGLCCAGSRWIYVVFIIQCRILRCHVWSSEKLSMSIIHNALSCVWMFMIFYDDLTEHYLLYVSLVRPQNSDWYLSCRMLYFPRPPPSILKKGASDGSLKFDFFHLFPNFTAFHILPPWITLLSLTMLPVVCSTMIFNNFHISWILHFKV